PTALRRPKAGWRRAGIPGTAEPQLGIGSWSAFSDRPIEGRVAAGGGGPGALAVVLVAHDGGAVAFVVDDAVGRHRLHQPDVGSDDGAAAHDGAAAEDGGAGVDGYIVLDVGVAFHAFHRVAVFVEFKGLRAEGHVLVDLHVVAD